MWKDGPAQESLLSSPRPRQAQGCHRTKRRPWLVGSSPGSSFAFLWKEYRLRQFKLTGSLGKEVGEGYNLLAPFSAIVRQDVVLAFTSRTAHWGRGAQRQGWQAALTGTHTHTWPDMCSAFHVHVCYHVNTCRTLRVVPDTVNMTWMPAALPDAQKVSYTQTHTERHRHSDVDILILRDRETVISLYIEALESTSVGVDIQSHVVIITNTYWKFTTQQALF